MDALDTPKEEEQQVMQTLVSLLVANTPTKTIQEPSTIVVPLQISTPGSSASRLAKVAHYGDTFLDKEILIPQFNFATMTLEDINMTQVALEKKKQQEIMRKEIKQRHAM